MHALEHEPPVFALDRQDPLHAKDVGAVCLQQPAQPGVERRPVERAVEFERNRTNGVVMRVFRVEDMLRSKVHLRAGGIEEAGLELFGLVLCKQRVKSRPVNCKREVVAIGAGEHQRPERFARRECGARLQHVGGRGEPGEDSFRRFLQRLGRRRMDGLQHRRHRRIRAVPKPECRLAVELQHAAPLERIFRFEEARLEVEGAAKIEAADIEHLLHGRVSHPDPFDPRHGIHRPEPALQSIDLLGIDQVDLVYQEHIGEGDLRHRFLAVIQVQFGMLRIDQGYDAVQVEGLPGVVVDEECLRHRSGVGHAGGFHQDPVELVAPLDQVAENPDQVASHGAADAAVVHLEDFFVGVDDQVLVDADLAELVFDHGDALTVVFGQDTVEQGGLAAAEKPGQHGYGDSLGHLAILSVTR